LARVFPSRRSRSGLGRLVVPYSGFTHGCCCCCLAGLWDREGYLLDPLDAAAAAAAAGCACVLCCAMELDKRGLLALLLAGSWLDAAAAAAAKEAISCCRGLPGCSCTAASAPAAAAAGMCGRGVFGSWLLGVAVSVAGAGAGAAAAAASVSWCCEKAGKPLTRSYSYSTASKHVAQVRFTIVWSVVTDNLSC
jgi:hypothetical protein